MRVVAKLDEKGKIVYSSEIIEAIVNYALAEIDGVVSLDKSSKVSKQVSKGVKIDTIGDAIYIDVYVSLRSDVEANNIAHEIQQNIKNALETMTEFKVKSINVHIVDVMFTKQAAN